MERTDVAIVGGGIAGSALALVLARRGVRVTVLERQFEYAARVRGEYMHPWGVDEAQQLEVLDVLLDAGAIFATPGRPVRRERFPRHCGGADLGDRRIGRVIRVISRRSVLVTTSVGLVAMSRRARAEQPGDAKRVAFLLPGSREQFAHLIRAFEERMRELGHVPGRHINVIAQFADGQPERLPSLAAELVRAKVDVIVVATNAVVTVARQATSTIPIVTAQVIDPVGAGFIASVPKPGGNITGVTSDATVEIWAKRLQLLKEAVPGVSRVTLLWNPTDRARVAYADEAEKSARTLGVSFHREEFRRVTDFPRAFSAMREKRIGAVLVAGDAATFSGRAELVKLAAQYSMPAGYPWREAVQIGGLMSYGVHFEDSYRRAAFFVDKILKGAKPGDLPVEQPTRFELVINLKTAKALGLTIPPALLQRADQVIGP